MQYLVAISKTTLSSLPRQTIQYHNNWSLCPKTTNAKEAEVEWFYEDLQDLLELTPKKRYPFHHRGLECKSRKSRDIWSNRQIWPWSTKSSRAKSKRVFPRECTGHSKCPLPTTQETTLHMDITRWSILKLVAQSCPTLCDPVYCSPPGSSVHGILQARILEWVAISFSRGSSQTRDWTQVSRIAGRRFNLWATREAPYWN